MISFWATWCKPCIKELDAIADVYDDWQDETGVQLVAVSIDDSRNTARVAPFVNGKGWEYTVLLDPNSDFRRAMGIDQTSRYSDVIEPKAHGTLSFAIRQSHEVKSPEWLDTVLLEIAEAKKPCLVVTSRYDTSTELAENYPDAIIRNQEEKETSAEAAIRLANDHTKDTLIAAAAWAGLDCADWACRLCLGGDTCPCYIQHRMT